MGTKKQLLPIHGRPAVVRCLESLRDANAAEIVLVIGPQAGDIMDAARGFPVRFAVNEIPESHMATSVKTGMACIDPDATGVLVCLCDHPLVRPATIEAMHSAHARMPDAIIIPVYKGRKGHPTLFPRPLLEELGTGATLRDIIGHHHEKISFLIVDDEGVILDMDTPEDYRRILDRYCPSY
jgi:molybdenum cofactor cytidylyltransferase